MKKISFIWTFIGFLFVLAACSDKNDIEYDSGSDIIVSKPEVLSVSGTSFTVSSSVSGNSDLVVKRGFCYSVNNQTPNINDNVVDADDSFSATVSGLMGNTTYYVCAYIYADSRYTIDEQLDNYIAPSYEDNYVSIADWSKRGQWNLSNVHDPTVVLAEDGYYYMYQTDASYGNAHTAGGHFHGRRSKNLVDWEYLGGTMQNLPDWVIPKLNEIRASEGWLISYVLFHSMSRIH